MALIVHLLMRANSITLKKQFANKTTIHECDQASQLAAITVPKATHNQHNKRKQQ